MEFGKSRIQTNEIPRMHMQIKNFIFYRWILISLIVVGLIFFFYFNPETLLQGLGIGLLAQSALMLFLDYFAEKRRFEYIDFLKNLSKTFFIRKI